MYPHPKIPHPQFRVQVSVRLRVRLRVWVSVRIRVRAPHLKLEFGGAEFWGEGYMNPNLNAHPDLKRDSTSNSKLGARNFGVRVHEP